ncbi:MAG: four helix bundle protein [Cyanobacteriota bacterium SKYGB_h_bin112]|nr:four helix bundle protein [Cyanobacteriota bacterium SKYGB_h_bin112]
MIHSGTSVGANVEKSQAAQSKADFLHKLEVALKELRVTRYWLRLLIATNLIPAQRLNALLEESEELLNIIVNTKRNRPECRLL